MLRLFMRARIVRGVLGGSRAWLAVGAGVVALRLVRKLAGDEPDVVHRQRLRPGDALLISYGRDAKVARKPS